jgi:hypothetical protein
VVTAVLTLAGCGGPTDTGSESSSPSPGASAAPDKPVLVEVTIRQGSIEPQGERIEVAVGQDVMIRVMSDAAEQIHVHSEPEHTYRVTPGELLEETFSIDKPGQVAVEAHEFGVTIVQLVVRP